MQYKIMNEEPFQILTSSISIGPSPTGYQLEVSADGKNFSPLFTVGANVTRQVTNLSSGSYYRLKGNEGQVVINWNRSCVTEGGADLSDYYTKEETDAIIQSAITSGVSLDAYWTSAQTESAITEAVSGKADAKILIDFDHTSQAERASLYADLYALYDGGSGATINRNYDFFKTVNTWQGLKIDYYGFSGDTLVFGKVVSPENMEDQVVYEQVMTIDSEGNVEVVTNIVGAASGDTDTEILKSYTGSGSELEEGDLTTFYSPTVCERLGMTYNGLEAEPQYSDRSGYTIQFPSIFSGSYAEFTEESPAKLGTINLTKQNPTGGFWTVYEILFYHDSSDNFCVKIKERDAATEYVFNLSAGTPNQYVFEDYTEFYMGFYKKSSFNPIYGTFLIGFQSPYDMPGKGSISVGVSNVQVQMNIGVVGRETLIKLGDIERIDRNTSQIWDAVHSLSSRTGNFITSGQADTQITNKLTDYTPTTGFSTVNGSAITAGGNIEIQAGGDMSAYYTSAQTEEAISAATSGKADAANVTAIASGALPKWNTQGIITGVADNIQARNAKIDGSTFKFYSPEGFDFPPIYAPKSAGNAGEILVSTGGTPVWSAVTIPDMTQYTPTSGFATVNGSAITNGGNIVIQGGSGGGISQADLASSGYLYYQDDGMGWQYIETNLDVTYDFLKGNWDDGFPIDPPQLVDYDAYAGNTGTPSFPKHLVTIYQSDYDDLVNNGGEDSETFYIVLPDPE